MIDLLDQLEQIDLHHHHRAVHSLTKREN